MLSYHFFHFPLVSRNASVWWLWGQFGLWEEIRWITGSFKKNLFEELVSEQTVKSRKRNFFSPFFALLLGFKTDMLVAVTVVWQICLLDEIQWIMSSSQKQQFNCKTGEWTNCKMENMQLFLTIFCIVALFLETHIGGGRGSVAKFGLREEIQWIVGCPGINHFIEKLVIEQTVNGEYAIVSHHYFALLLGFMTDKRVVALVRWNLVCERRYNGLWVRPRNNNLIEKSVSELSVT